VASLLGAKGSVLPCSTVPMSIHAMVRDDSGQSVAVHGQGNIARLTAPVDRVWVTPNEPPACREALAAISTADAIVLGPGSWYTSVLPHLLIPEQRIAIAEATGRRILIMNVSPTSDRETLGLTLDEHLRILTRYAPEIRIDTIIADPKHAPDRIALEEAARTIGGTVHYADVESSTPGIHDPDLLAAALRTVLNAR
jgi:uncharacterized cofD-like protein